MCNDLPARRIPNRTTSLSIVLGTVGVPSIWRMFRKVSTLEIGHFELLVFFVGM